MTLQIDLVEALRCPIYRDELSRELESGVTDMVMHEAADEIERLRGIIRDMGALARQQSAIFGRWVNDDWQREHAGCRCGGLSVEDDVAYLNGEQNDTGDGRDA